MVLIVTIWFVKHHQISAIQNTYNIKLWFRIHQTYNIKVWIEIPKMMIKSCQSRRISEWISLLTWNVTHTNKLAKLANERRLGLNKYRTNLKYIVTNPRVKVTNVYFANIFTPLIDAVQLNFQFKSLFFFIVVNLTWKLCRNHRNQSKWGIWSSSHHHLPKI